MKLWIAQGFGIGRIPFAPGTFGSLLGLLWFAILLASGNIWLLVAGLVAGAALSVWLCGAAEKILGKKDPGSVVLDEIAAIPACYLTWVILLTLKNGELPAPAYFCTSHKWLMTLAVFGAFRFFDVVKPWPVRQSQSLPRGWGITVDDLLAAGYVNLALLLAHAAGLPLTK